MKKWQIGGILTTLIIALVLMSGCINQSTAKNSSGSINPNVITTAMLTPSQCYKTADHVNYANSVYEYGFKMDYPCGWSDSYSHATFFSDEEIFGFSSPDNKSHVDVYAFNLTGINSFFGSDRWRFKNLKTWAAAELKDMIGNDTSIHYSDESLILSGNIPARKLVVGQTTRYLMFSGAVRGYKFINASTQREVAVEVDGFDWDYGVGGQAYAITTYTPYNPTNFTSGIFDHMINSFEIIPHSNKPISSVQVITTFPTRTPTLEQTLSPYQQCADALEAKQKCDDTKNTQVQADYCRYWESRYLIVCSDAVLYPNGTPIPTTISDVPPSVTPTVATVYGDYCGPMSTPYGLDTDACLHLDNSGQVEIWVKHNRGTSLSSSSHYTINKGTVVITLPGGWTTGGIHPSQTLECTYSSGGLSCGGAVYARASPSDL